MEAIGTLAGGIAHDFNNILSPITGFTEMILMEVGEDSPFHDNLMQVLESAKRGGALIKQILSFSRKGEPEIKPLDLKKLLIEVLKLTRSTLPATIQIEQNIGEGIGYILADSTQIHQVMKRTLLKLLKHCWKNWGIM